MTGPRPLPPLIRTRWFRALIRFCFRWKGLRVLGHLVRRTYYRANWIDITDFDGDLALRCRLDEHIGSQMYWRGSYSWNQLPVLDDILEDGMVFVDVGANQGEFTLFAAKRLPRGHVIAFEPMSDMYERLCFNVDANGFRNVSAHHLGLWSKRTRLPIFRQASQFSDGSLHEGLGTVFPTEERSSRVEEIVCVALDEFARDHHIDRIDVMKLDIEGAELRALEGARDTIHTHRPTILIEFDPRCIAAADATPEQVLTWLEELYALEVIVGNGRTRPFDRTRTRLHQNLLCRPRVD